MERELLFFLLFLLSRELVLPTTGADEVFVDVGDIGPRIPSPTMPISPLIDFPLPVARALPSLPAVAASTFIFLAGVGGIAPVGGDFVEEFLLLLLPTYGSFTFFFDKTSLFDAAGAGAGTDVFVFGRVAPVVRRLATPAFLTLKVGVGGEEERVFPPPMLPPSAALDFLVSTLSFPLSFLIVLKIETRNQPLNVMCNFLKKHLTWVLLLKRL